MTPTTSPASSRRGQVALALAACLSVAAPWWIVPHPAVGAALAVAPLMVVFAIRNPFLLSLAFIIFSFFRIHEAFRVLEPLRIPQLLAMGTLLAIALHLATGRLRPYWSRECTVFLVYFALVTVGILFAVNRAEALAYWTGTYFKIAIMVYAIAWLTCTEKEFSLATRIFVAAGIAVAGVALYNKSNGIGLVEGTRVTISRDIGSLLGDPNDLSLVLLFPVSFAYSLALLPGMKAHRRLFGLAGVGIMLAAIIATQSRGGLLGFMAVSAIFGQYLIRSKLLLAIIAALGILVLTAAAGLSDRASGGGAEQGIDESAMGRLYAWGAAMNMATSHPLMGVGLNNFTPNYYFYSSHWDGRNHAVHSTWFGVLAETGFTGFAVFIGMTGLVTYRAFSVARTLSRLPRDQNFPADVHAVAWALAAGMVGFIVSGTFLTQGFTWPIYIELSLVIAVSRFAKSNGYLHSDRAYVVSPDAAPSVLVSRPIIARPLPPPGP